MHPRLHFEHVRPQFGSGFCHLAILHFLTSTLLQLLLPLACYAFCALFRVLRQSHTTANTTKGRICQPCRICGYCSLETANQLALVVVVVGLDIHIATMLDHQLQ